MNQQIVTAEIELTKVCCQVRELVNKLEYSECELIIKNTMVNYPHAPEPHNLIGILLEKKGEHIRAMKHFRAAWALDPTYIPARYNLDYYGTFYQKGDCAFDVSDCTPEVKSKENVIEYDECGIGHVVRRRKK